MTSEPPPELELLAPFERFWRYDGRIVESPLGPGRPVRGTWSGERSLDGFWIHCPFENKPTPLDPVPGKGLYQFTYDRASSKFVAVWTDNWGGWIVETSPGWQGSTIVFSGEYIGMGFSFRSSDVFKLRSDRQLDYHCEVTMNGRKFLYLQYDFTR